MIRYIYNKALVNMSDPTVKWDFAAGVTSDMLEEFTEDYRLLLSKAGLANMTAEEMQEFGIQVYRSPNNPGVVKMKEELSPEELGINPDDPRLLSMIHQFYIIPGDVLVKFQHENIPHFVTRPFSLNFVSS